jgi:hypothetical protein
MCDNETGYMKHLKTNPAMCEVIGEYKQYIKPVFDVDAYKNDIDIDAVKADINMMFPDKTINYAKREPRETKKGIKYSYRFYVDGVKIYSFQIKQLLIDHKLNENPIYDLSIYDKNKVLFLPLTTQKENGVAPQLCPIDCDIFKCCASYVEKDFEDWTPKCEKTKGEKLLQQINQFYDKKDEMINDEDVAVIDTKYIETKLKLHLAKMSVIRSSEYDNWTKMIWCLMNICKKEGIGRSKCSKIIHEFSAKSANYEEDSVDKFIDNNYDNIKEASYGWKYFNECLKCDDPEYYDSITMKMYNNMKKDFELNHAKILHPPMIVYFNKEDKYDIFTVKSCKESYAHLQCKLKVKDKWETKQFIDLWLKDSKIRVFDKVVFEPPPIVCDTKNFNTWVDFKIVKEPLVETERDYWAEYKQYLHNVIGDEKIVNYILARYAFRIVNPATRTNVILIICGNEGDGKNRLLAPIYNIMKGYTCMLDNAKKLYESHSMFEFQKLFLLVNEAAGVANFENSEILKTRATEPTLTVNPKGIQAFEIDNMCDYDMTTNNLNVVKLSDDSRRRFLQIETTSYYKNNYEFFNDYFQNIENNPVALRQIYEGLINFDYKAIVPSLNFQDVRYKPTTTIEDNVRQQNRDKVIWFFEDWVRQHLNLNTKDDMKYKNETLFKMYIDWCEVSKVKMDYNKISFGMRVTVLMKKQLNINGFTCVKKDTKHSMTTLYLSEFKNYFKNLNGFEFGDQEEDEEIE